MSARGAVLSPDMLYRYRLWRQLSYETDSRVLWVMLNPSTADGFDDDPTLRRVMGFSRAWGFGWCEVVNLYALRAAKPGALLTAASPVGPCNLTYIEEALLEPHLEQVILGWGRFKGPAMKWRIDDVLARVDSLHGQQPYCLGKNKNGSPIHPLYLASDTDRTLFRRTDATPQAAPRYT